MSEQKNSFNGYSVQEDGERGYHLDHIRDANAWDFDKKFHYRENDMQTETSEWPDDEKIYLRVCDMLFRDGIIDEDEVDVEVDNGVVTLSGEVSGRSAKKYAEDRLSHIFGITKVINHLTVREGRGLVGSSDGWPV